MKNRKCVRTAVFFALAAGAAAQEYRATVLGTITDATGAVVANAKVSLVNTQTGVNLAVRSNAEGLYTVPFVVPGQYRLVVENPGFKTFEQSPIELHVNDRTRIDVQLEVGQVTDHTTVTAEAPLVEEAAADRGQVIENRQVTELPTQARNPYTLMNLASHGIPAQIIGGWQFSWNIVIQSGTPVSLPGGYYLTGDPRLSSGQTLDHWFNTSPQLWATQPADTLRTMPFYSPNLRIDSRPQSDVTVLRQVRITERHHAEFRMSAFNLTNTPIFGAPNNSPTSNTFGAVTKSQINLPRSMELALRYRF